MIGLSGVLYEVSYFILVFLLISSNLFSVAYLPLQPLFLLMGVKQRFFSPSRGIRQGDPLSPYLFILCMEFRGALIHSKCEEGAWTRLRASRWGPGFFHIFFVDDLLLFAKANFKNCDAISEVLQTFCTTSGQKISNVKSRVFFSPTVPNSTRNGICHKLGVFMTSSLGKYLGFPIIHSGKTRNDFQFVVERVQAKLDGWKSKLLSPAGRLVLIKSAALPISDYVMQCVALPTKIYSSVDKLCRDFLWGSTLEKRKLHLVNWSKVTLPTDIGGLGIFQMKHRNSALLAKLCWRIATDKDKPWAQILIKKYLTPSRLSHRGKHRPCSKIWAGCKKGGVIFNKGIRWKIHNGNSVGFWNDFWLTSGPLRAHIQGPLTTSEESLLLSDVSSGNSWNFGLLSFDFPFNLLQEIRATPFSTSSSMEDTIIWGFSSDGDFSLKSAYYLAKGLNPLNLVTNNAWIWKVMTSPWIKFFLWLCSHSSVPTYEVLGSRGLSIDSLCPICGLQSESIIHMLRDCYVVKIFLDETWYSGL